MSFSTVDQTWANGCRRLALGTAAEGRRAVVAAGLHEKVRAGFPMGKARLRACVYSGLLTSFGLFGRDRFPELSRSARVWAFWEQPGRPPATGRKSPKTVLSEFQSTHTRRPHPNLAPNNVILPFSFSLRHQLSPVSPSASTAWPALHKNNSKSQSSGHHRHPHLLPLCRVPLSV